MIDSTASILELYTQVIDKDSTRNNISRKDFNLGIRNMVEAYAPMVPDFESNISVRKFTDFSIPGYRCAYLHKYAPLHTYVVLDTMKEFIKEQTPLFEAMLKSKKFKLCCLGGGPGSDAVGVLAALHTVFTSFKSSVTIIDYIEEWKNTFDLITDHLRSAEYGMQWNDCDFNYIGADLLNFQCTTVSAVNSITIHTVNNTINTASLITMIKFISAAACANTEQMVEVSSFY